MIAEGLWNQEQEDELNNELDEQIKIAWEKAMNDPYPNPDATLKYIYSCD
jgi:TPP-dependent pyruvate/acetoin dehydrogenase alpha subunit